MSASDPHSYALFNRCLAARRSSDWRRFIDLHETKIRKMLRLAARKSGVPLADPDLDEAVQELYCRLLAAQPGFHGRSEQEMWTYLSQAVRNLAVDRKRSLSSKKRLPNPRRVRTSRLRSARLDPEQRLLEKERRRVFFQRCMEVVRCDRVVVELRALALALLEGWTSREIAHELEGRVSEHQIDSLVHRLRRHLARDGIRLPRRTCLRPAPAPAC